MKKVVNFLVSVYDNPPVALTKMEKQATGMLTTEYHYRTEREILKKKAASCNSK